MVGGGFALGLGGDAIGEEGDAVVAGWGGGVGHAICAAVRSQPIFRKTQN